ATAVAAASEAPVQARVTTDWDRRRYPVSPDLVVFELVTPVPPESAVRTTIDTAIPSPAGPEHPPRVQTHTITMERALFVDGAHCRAECDPDISNPIALRGRAAPRSIARAVSVVDITDTRRPEPVAAGTGERSENPLDLDSDFTLEELG